MNYEELTPYHCSQALIELLEITEDVFSSALRRHGIGQTTINSWLDPSGRKPLRVTARQNLSKAILLEWKTSISADCFLVGTVAEFRGRIERGRVRIDIPWHEEQLLPSGFYRAYRYAFAAPTRVSVEMLFINGKNCSNYYRQAETDAVRSSSGVVISNRGGMMIITSNPTFLDPEIIRPKVFSVSNHDTGGFRFGYLTSTTPTYLQPCVTPVVFERRDDLTSENQCAALANSLTVEDFLQTYHNGKNILRLLSMKDMVQGNASRVAAEKYAQILDGSD